MKGETMDKSFDIQAYMTKGVERVVGDIVRATFRNPRESAYMARFALASRAASKRRRKAENAGEHIPAFPQRSIFHPAVDLGHIPDRDKEQENAPMHEE